MDGRFGLITFALQPYSSQFCLSLLRHMTFCIYPAFLFHWKWACWLCLIIWSWCLLPRICRRTVTVLPVMFWKRGRSISNHRQHVTSTYISPRPLRTHWASRIRRIDSGFNSIFAHFTASWGHLSAWVTRRQNVAWNTQGPITIKVVELEKRPVEQASPFSTFGQGRLLTSFRRNFVTWISATALEP